MNPQARSSSRESKYSSTRIRYDTYDDATITLVSDPASAAEKARETLSADASESGGDELRFDSENSNLLLPQSRGCILTCYRCKGYQS